MDKEDEYLDSLTKEAMLRIVKDKLEEYGQSERQDSARTCCRNSW